MTAKKSKTGAIIGITLGVLTLGAIGFFVFKKKSDSGSGTGEGAGTETPETLLGTITGQIGNAVSTVTSGGAGKTYKVAYLQERAADKHLVINLAAPRPPANTIKNGTRIKISNMGRYDGIHKTISNWTDNSGNMGAVYVYTGLVTSENNDNRSYPNATITVLI